MKDLFNAERELDIVQATARAKVTHALSRRWMRRVWEQDPQGNWRQTWTLHYTIPYDETKSEQTEDRDYALRSF